MEQKLLEAMQLLNDFFRIKKEGEEVKKMKNSHILGYYQPEDGERYIDHAGYSTWRDESEYHTVLRDFGVSFKDTSERNKALKRARAYKDIIHKIEEYNSKHEKPDWKKPTQDKRYFGWDSHRQQLRVRYDNVVICNKKELYFVTPIHAEMIKAWGDERYIAYALGFIDENELDNKEKTQ